MATSSSATNSPLKPARENPLSNFSSYTYNISLYMLTPESYNEYTTGGAVDSSKWKLVCRSGGINNNKARADGFTLDYYIDNLQIVTQISGKETGVASNSYKFSFQVIEPYGFKFPTQLITAAANIQEQTSNKRPDQIDETAVALQSLFLLSVRFYGYDSNGNLIDPKNYPQSDITTTEKDSVFERNWPITIHSFKFKLDNKMIVYDIQAATIGEHAGFAKTTGLTKETFQIKGKTVKDMLVGSTSDSTKGSIVGLVEQLNNIQLEKQKQKELAVPDTYSITFAPNSGIDTAIMVELNDAILENAPAKSVNSSSAVTVKLAERAPVISKLTKPLIVGEEPILGVIERVITQSSFVTNALNIKDKEGRPIVSGDKNYYENSNASSTTLAWYNVTPVVKYGKFDDIRKRYAYDINYLIQRYEIPNIRGIDIGKKAPYPGPYKRYQHYYMGDTQDAKEIIGYEQEYNLLFFNLIAQSSQAPVKNNDNGAPAESGSADASTIGGKSGSSNAKTVTALKTFLFSPSEQLKARIMILGDPDFLMTSTNRGIDVAIKKYYGEDGNSINPCTGQVFIEVAFRNVEDYTSTDGLLNPSKDGDIVFWKYPPSIAKQIQGVAYNIYSITSTFTHGKFTQELKVSIPPFTDDSTDSSTSTSTSTSNANGTGSTNSTTLDSSGRMSSTTDPRSTITNTTNLIATTKVDATGRATSASDDRLQTTAPVNTPIVYQTTATQNAAATANAPIVASDDGNKPPVTPTPTSNIRIITDPKTGKVIGSTVVQN